MDLRQYFVLLSRGSRGISNEKINELLDNPLLPTPIGQCLMRMGYDQLPPTEHRLISFFHRAPEVASEISIHGEWVKGTNRNDNTSVYLMGFTGEDLFLIVRPNEREIQFVMRRFHFPFRYNPDLVSIAEIQTLKARESTPDTPEFCFFERLLHLMDTPEKKRLLREFKAGLLVLYANHYRSILQSLVAFLNNENENRIRADEPPVMTTDNDQFREMVKIVPIENGPLYRFNSLGVKSSRKRKRKPTRKPTHRKRTHM
jgi:hypothetical protein